jgi:hypothetical protein
MAARSLLVSRMLNHERIGKANTGWWVWIRLRQPKAQGYQAECLYKPQISTRYLQVPLRRSFVVMFVQDTWLSDRTRSGFAIVHGFAENTLARLNQGLSNGRSMGLIKGLSMQQCLLSSSKSDRQLIPPCPWTLVFAKQIWLKNDWPQSGKIWNDQYA